MRRLAVAITGLELPAVEKISQSREEDPFQVTIATLLSARTQDATTYAASERLFKKAATPQAMGKLTVKQIEKLIYPGELLSLQGAIHQSDVREADKGVRREDPVDDGRAADAARCRTEDREPGVDSRVREPEEHLRRHARASHRKPARLGAHEDAGRNRAGALPRNRVAMVAVHQSLSRHVGTERVPAGVSTVSGVRHQGFVPAHRRDGRQ